MTQVESELLEELIRVAGSQPIPLSSLQKFIGNPKDVFRLPILNLCRWNYKTISQQTKLKKSLGEQFPDFETLDEYFANEGTFEKIQFNVKSIDSLLRGGLDISSVTEIFGAAGSGKTQLCLHLAFNCRLPIEQGGKDSKVFYITTDKPACVRRLNQLDKAFKLKHGDIDFLGGIYISEFNEASQLQDFVMNDLPKFLEFSKIKVFIIDSIAGIYRTESDFRKRARELCDVIQQLLALAEKHKFAILVTNHVTSPPGDDNDSEEIENYFSSEEAALGETWESLVTSRLYLTKRNYSVSILIDEKEEMSRVRKLEVTFSPNLASTAEASFIITSRGIEDEPTP